jgi:hypothetical protein
LQFYIKTLFTQIDKKSVFVLFLLVMLMLIQWLVEAVKWQLLLKQLIDLPIRKAVFMIFTGISFSIATPNRFGEFIGRIMHLPKGLQLQGTGYTFIGNFAQLIATCIAGSIGIYFFQPEITKPEEASLSTIVSIFLYLGPLITLFCLFIYFKSSFFFSYVAQIKLFSNWKDKFLQLSQLSRQLLLQLLLLSLLRYCIFLIQYGFIFAVTEMGFGFAATCMGISVMLFWLAVLPTVSLVELGLRWQLSIVLFAPFTSNVFGLTMGITLIWLLNMVIPAGIGLLLLFVHKLKKARYMKI